MGCRGGGGVWIRDCVREPSSSFLVKQLSIILRFSSSNLSALVISRPPGIAILNVLKRSRQSANCGVRSS